MSNYCIFLTVIIMHVGFVYKAVFLKKENNNKAALSPSPRKTLVFVTNAERSSTSYFYHEKALAYESPGAFVKEFAFSTTPSIF